MSALWKTLKHNAKGAIALSLDNQFLCMFLILQVSTDVISFQSSAYYFKA